MKKSGTNESGFTLVELMIAAVVVSVVIVGYVGANITAQRNTEEMHERTVAIQDANRLIERMRSDSRDVASFPADLVADYPEYDPANAANTTITELDPVTNHKRPMFSNLTGETTLVSYTAPDPLDATVTIAWTSYTGRTHSEAVRTYITQR